MSTSSTTLTTFCVAMVSNEVVEEGEGEMRGSDGWGRDHTIPDMSTWL